MNNRFSLYGTIKIVAIGAYIEEFLSDFMKSGMKVYCIENVNGAVYLSVRRSDYKRIARLARNHQVRVRVYEKNKRHIKINKNGKYLGILTGLIIMMLMIIISEKFILKINVYGSDSISEQQILKSIAEKGIFIGAYSDSIETDPAELNAKLSIKDISWINIEINGSRADVFINEGEMINKPEISVKTPCNVVAGRDGVIVETQVYSGTLLYPAGSGISEGSVIISGVVNDGADNLIITHANGKIIAEFSESVQFRQDFRTTEKVLNNVDEQEKELLFMGAVIPLTSRVEQTNNKICEEYISKCKFLGLDMPWSIKTNTYNSYNEIEVSRTYDDVNRILQQKLELYCQNFYNEYEILDVKQNMLYDDEGITMTAEIKLKGDIAVQQEILRKNNVA